MYNCKNNGTLTNKIPRTQLKKINNIKLIMLGVFILKMCTKFTTLNRLIKKTILQFLKNLPVS